MIDIQQIAHSFGKATKGSDGWYSCLCPAHDDKNPSLSIKENDNGKLIVKCYTGCSPERIFQELENRRIYSHNSHNSHNPNFHKSSPYNPNNNATEQSNKNALQQWENLLLEGQSDYLKKRELKTMGLNMGKMELVIS